MPCRHTCLPPASTDFLLVEQPHLCLLVEQPHSAHRTAPFMSARRTAPFCLLVEQPHFCLLVEKPHFCLLVEQPHFCLLVEQLHYVSGSVSKTWRNFRKIFNILCIECTITLHMWFYSFVIADKINPLTVLGSAADPGWLSRIPYPTTEIEERRKFVGLRFFFCSHKYDQIDNYFIFGQIQKKLWSNSQQIIVLFAQNIITKFSKIWVWGARSGKKHIPEPGVKKAPEKPLEKNSWYKQWARPKRPKPSREIDTWVPQKAPASTMCNHRGR